MVLSTTWRRRGRSAMIRIITWLGITVAVMSALGWVAHGPPSTALADEAVGQVQTGLTFDEPVAAGEGISLSVRLTADDGQPISRARVEFFVNPDFFGERPVSLQTVITNADGLASLKYVPTWNGVHRVTALFAGNSDYQPGEVTTVMTVSGTVTAPASKVESLHVLRQWAAPAVTLGAIIVWLLIVGVLLRVGWGVWQERDLGKDVVELPRTAVEKLTVGTNR